MPCKPKQHRSLIQISLIVVGLSTQIAMADCPQPADLIAPNFDTKQFIWQANGGWKSEVSFAETIDKFVGAQWIGTNVGSVTCIYKDKSEGTFPLGMQNGKIVYMPTGGKWQKPSLQKGDIIETSTVKINCVASQVEWCPFPNTDLQSDSTNHIRNQHSKPLHDVPSQLLDKNTDRKAQSAKNSALDALLGDVDRDVHTRREEKIKALVGDGMSVEEANQHIQRYGF